MRISKYLSLFFLILFAGCATIFGHRKYEVAINSEPVGADFKILDEDGEVIESSVAPKIVTVTSGGPYFNAHNYKVMCSKEGHHNDEREIKASINGWYWGNIALGGLVGMIIVDPLTGMMYKINEKEITCRIPPVEPEKKK